jgi:hypothetical protein
MNTKALLLAATLFSLATPSFAADQFIDLSSGKASFIGTDPVLSGGEDLISFFGLDAGEYTFSLTLSSQNITDFSGSFNGMPLNEFTDGSFTFLFLKDATSEPFELSLTGLANFASLYSGEITVSLAPVPEPETYGMMLAGLALVGYAARRRLG